MGHAKVRWLPMCEIGDANGITYPWLSRHFSSYGDTSAKRAGFNGSIMMSSPLLPLATVTVPLDRWSRSYPRVAVAPAMGSLRREANFTKDLTPTDDPFLL